MTQKIGIFIIKKSFILWVLTYTFLSSVFLWNYFDYRSGRRGHKPLRLKDPNPKGINIILWTRKRSGSNFLSHLLEGHPSSMVFYEPVRHIIGEDASNLTAVVHHLKALCNCTVRHFFEYFLGQGVYWKFDDLVLCNQMPQPCKDLFYHELLCVVTRLRIFKLVSPKLSAAIPLLQETTPKTRILHLVRDPRGIFPSRRRLLPLEGITPRDVNVTVLCQILREDLQAAQELQRAFPRRYLMIRYEDLSLHPETVLRRVFAFLGQSYTARVHKRVMELTLGLAPWRSKEGPQEYEVSMNSSATVFRWRSEASWESTKAIQEECRDVIQNLGLRVFASEQEYLDHNISALMER